MAAPVYTSSAPLFEAGGVSGETPIAGGVGPVAQTGPAPTGQTVNVIDPTTGETYGLDAAYLPEALARGYKPETAEHAGIRKYVAENRSLSGEAKGALGSLAEQATFGVSEVLIKKALDPYEYAKWEALKADHAAARMVGGAAGFGLSLLYGGEFFGAASKAGLAAEKIALGTAGKTAAKALTAELAYRGAEAGAQKVGSGVARKILASAANYGTQGLVLSSPKAMAQAITGDPERAAETWIYSAAGGAALGGLVGAGGSIADKVRAKFFTASAGASEVASLTDEVARAEQEAAASIAPDESTTARLNELKVKLESARENLAGHHSKLPEYAEAFSQYATGKPGRSLRSIAKDFAEEQAIKSINPYKKFADKLADMPGGEKAAGRLLLDKGLLPKTNEAVEEYAARLAEHTAKVGERIGSYYDMLAEAGDVVQAKSLARNLRAGVLDPLKKKIGYKSQVAKVEAYIDDFERVYGLKRKAGEKSKDWSARIKDVRVNVKELHERRFDLDRLIYGEDAALTADKVADEFRAIRRIYNMELENGIQKAGDALSITPERLAEIQKLNREFGAFKTITQAVEKNIGRTLANRSASLSDYVSGAAGAAAGALFGPVGSTVGGVVAGYVNNQLRRNANAWLAELADMYARTGHVPDVVARAYQRVGEGLVPGKWAGVVDRYAPIATDATEGKGMVALEKAFGDHSKNLDEIPRVLESLAGGPSSRTASSRRNGTFAVNILTRFLGADSDKGDLTVFADNLASLATDPVKMQEKIEEATSELTADAPEVAIAAGIKLQQAAIYLHEKAPKPPGLPPSPFEPKQQWTPTQAQKKDYRTRVETAIDPYKAIDALEDGTLTKAHVETLQALAPKILQEMVKRVMDHGASGKAKPLPYAERLRLSMLTGAPLDRSLANIASMQNVFKQAPAETSGSKMKLKGPQLQTDVGRISTT